MPYKTSDYHPAFEEYCETIFELQEDGVDVIQARIVERLQVSRPAVSEMVKKMKEADLVQFNGNSIFLSDKGKALANQVVRRHRLAERFLTDVLGLSWAEAHHEAGKWEHVVSPTVEAAFLKLLEDQNLSETEKGEVVLKVLRRIMNFCLTGHRNFRGMSVN